jgi:hypothetical protein
MVDGVEIFSDIVIQHEVIVVKVLTDLHECMNEARRRRYGKLYETDNDDFFDTLESIIDRIPPKHMEVLEYNVPVMA